MLIFMAVFGIWEVKLVAIDDCKLSASHFALLLLRNDGCFNLYNQICISWFSFNFPSLFTFTNLSLILFQDIDDSAVAKKVCVLIFLRNGLIFLDSIFLFDFYQILSYSTTKIISIDYCKFLASYFPHLLWRNVVCFKV